MRSPDAIILGCAAAVATALLLLTARIKRRRSPPQVVQTQTLSLRELPRAAVPAELLVSTYFNLNAATSRGFDHVEYLRSCFDVSAVLDGLHDYAVATIERFIEEQRRSAILASDTSLRDLEMLGWVVQGSSGTVVIEEGAAFAPERVLGGDATLYVCRGARVSGGAFDLSAGSIFLGANTVVEPGTLVRGPTLVGTGVTLRHGAYVRGDVVLGANGVFGGELKNVLALDEAELPHTGYCGDSLLGHHAHFGCGAVTANFPLFAASRPVLTVHGTRYDLGRTKFGAVLGDGSQLGCNSVTEPGCLIAPDTHAYPLCRLARGAYGPHELLKNRPTIERAPLRRPAAAKG